MNRAKGVFRYLAAATANVCEIMLRKYKVQTIGERAVPSGAGTPRAGWRPRQPIGASMKRPNKHLTIGVLAAGIALFAGSAIVSGAGASDGGTVLVPAYRFAFSTPASPTAPCSHSARTKRPRFLSPTQFLWELGPSTSTSRRRSEAPPRSWPSIRLVGTRPTVSAVNWNGPTSQANAIAVKLSDDYKVDHLQRVRHR